MNKIIISFTFIFLLSALHGEELSSNKLFTKYCFDCHDNEMQEGKINLESAPINWLDNQTGDFYEKILRSLETEYMPPAKKKKKPSLQERHAMVNYIKKKLQLNVKIGNTGLRRLTNVEYKNSIESIFKINYPLPEYFPPENTALGKMDLASSMQMSDILLQAYYDVATDVANKILPPPAPQRKIQSVTFNNESEPTRLVSSLDIIARSIKFEKNFGAQYTGDYKVTLRMKPFRSTDAFYKDQKTYTLQLLTLDEAANIFQNYPKSEVKAEFTIKDGDSWRTFSKTIRIEEGQTIAYRWKNGPILSGSDRRLLVEVNDRRLSDQRFWKAFDYVEKRGLSPRDLFKQVSSAYDNSLQSSKPKKYNKGKQLNAVVHNYFQSYLFGELEALGPALDVAMVNVEGPLKVYKSKKEKDQEAITNRFLGKQGSRSKEQYLHDLIKPLVSSIFRRPATKEQIEKYSKIALLESLKTGRLEDGLHLVIRTALTSPKFLYFYTQKGQMDSYDLATRLSYFLTLKPAEPQTLKLAELNKLIIPEILRSEAKRLLSSNNSDQFINLFVDKWLHLEKLDAIMPDEKLKRFTENDRKAYKSEAQLFFKEILRKNLPIETFISADFTYVNKETAKSIYGITTKFDNKMKRVNLGRDSVRGGLLTLPGVLMATANGVSTQPVIRGVWFLDNILGVKLPHPPSSVPALEPDLTKATTVKQQIIAHQEDPNCASCHKIIDPVGFALENFDAIGQWRSSYVTYKEIGMKDGISKRYKKLEGKLIDSEGIMPDGTKIKDVKALKNYLLKNIDMFSNCLSEKLMTFATGRKMNYADKEEIAKIVQRVKSKGNGFKDLIVELINSKVFRTK